MIIKFMMISLLVTGIVCIAAAIVLAFGCDNQDPHTHIPDSPPPEKFTPDSADLGAGAAVGPEVIESWSDARTPAEKEEAVTGVKPATQPESQ